MWKKAFEDLWKENRKERKFEKKTVEMVGNSVRAMEATRVEGEPSLDGGIDSVEVLLALQEIQVGKAKALTEW